MAVASFLVGVTALAQQCNFKEKTVFKNDDVEFRQLDEHTWHGNGHQVYDIQYFYPGHYWGDNLETPQRAARLNNYSACQAQSLCREPRRDAVCA